MHRPSHNLLKNLWIILFLLEYDAVVNFWANDFIVIGRVSKRPPPVHCTMILLILWSLNSRMST